MKSAAQHRKHPFKRIVFPFNRGNNHWVVFCIDVEEGYLSVYDSLPNSTPWDKRYDNLIRVLCAFVSTFH